MKIFASAALALLLGLFIGGYSPRSDVRRLEAELAKAKEETASAKASSVGAGAAMFPAALGALAAAAGPRTAVPPPRFVNSDPPGKNGDGPDAGTRSRRDPIASLQAAKVGMDIKAAFQKAQFFDQARLSPEKQAAFEDSVKKMNDALSRSLDQIAGLINNKDTKEKPTFRTLLDSTSPFFDAYRKLDDDFKAGLDDGGRAALDKTKFELISQLDLGVVEKAMAAAKQREQAKAGP